MNKKLYYLVLWIVLCAPGISAGKNKDFEVTPSIDEVRSLRVGKHFVRYIHYNREEMPVFVFELIKTPKRILFDKIYVNQVTIDVEGKAKKLYLHNKSMVELRQLKVQGDKVSFDLEYISGERGEGDYLVGCAICIAENKFQVPECKLLKAGLE